MTHRYYIATMGCQMNEYDSDYLSQLLIDIGFQPTENHFNADLILINTCAVREKAEQKAFSLLGRMLSIKRKRPDLILGITGCVAQKEGSALIKRFPELDLVLGTREIGRIPEIIKRILNEHEKVAATDLSCEPPSFINNNGYFRGNIKSHISIMEGCNNFCSYCIVPYVRGREFSRSPREILKEAENLISQGIKEITLLGQNVNSYSSRGEEEMLNFPMLLRTLSRLEGLARIRFTTSHPKDLSVGLISCFKDLDNLCHHIHLPFQSGSNRILRLMNRKYTREKYMELVNKLRTTRPDIAITSDVMVGFPGESREDFQMTLDLIEKIEFDNLFSFKYSDRKGVLAEKMDGKISEEEKAYRLKILQQLQKNITLRKNKCLEGTEEEVLVEGESKKGGQYTGRTRTNKVINIDCNNNILGSLVKVSIKRAFINSLQGTLVEENS
ncbi:tRNA (N6-isopentenyl adenosine(37)-C2)-methylthiotransferase MiaB [Thermodesulfobacteriota bacterium]